MIQNKESGQNRTNKPRIPCKFFQNGKCNFGDKCKNLHEKISPPSQSQTKQTNNKTIYLDGLLASSKVQCQGCKHEVFPVFLSCGCANLCIKCACLNKPCGQQHDYEEIIQFFIIASDCLPAHSKQMIASKHKHQRTIDHNNLKISARYLFFSQELESHRYDLSEQTCTFLIESPPTVRKNFLVLRMYVKPLVGLYEGIEFRPHLYLNLIDNVDSPKLLNDRRIYHPNIDFISAEICVPEIINYNPTWNLTKHLSRIKYTIIEPNSETVPNNQWNKTAASLYILARDTNFRDKIIENNPAYLEQLISSSLKNQIETQDKEKKKKKKFLSFNQIIPFQRSLDFDEGEYVYGEVIKRMGNISFEETTTP